MPLTQKLCDICDHLCHRCFNFADPRFRVQRIQEESLRKSLLDSLLECGDFGIRAAQFSESDLQS